MQTIEYRAQYTGVESIHGTAWKRDPSYEMIRVQARDINSGFSKALKVAREPLGNGRVREIGALEFRKIA